MKYTNEDVENSVSNIVALMYKLGLMETHERPRLIEREVLDGEAVLPWRLFIRDTRLGMSGHFSPGFLTSGELGWTNREAAEKAGTIASTLHYIHNNRDKIRG